MTDTSLQLGTGQATVPTGSAADQLLKSTIIPAANLSSTPPIQTVNPPVDNTNHAGIIAGSLEDLQAKADAQQANVDNLNSLNSDTSNPNSIASNILSLMGQEDNKAADTQAAQDTSGATALAKQLNDLNAQAKNLNLEAQAIPIQTQEKNANTGATDAGVAPQTTGALRQNALKALSLSQQANIATGNYNAAKDIAQRAIDLKYLPIEQKLATLQQQYNFNKDALVAADAKRAAAAQALITKQQNDLAQAKTIAQNNANDQNTYAKDAMDGGQSKLAAQIIQLDPTSATFKKDLANLQKQITPNTLQALDIQNKQLQNEKLRQDIKNAQVSNSPTVITTTPQGNPISIPTDVAPYYNTSSSGVGYIDASTLQGTAAEKTKIINNAQAAGLKVITNKNMAADLVNIGDAKTKLDYISQIMAGISQPNALSRALGGIGLTKFAEMTQSSPQKAASGALQSVGLDILKAISGIQGFRGNQTAIQQVTNHLPSIYDTQDTINQKVTYIKGLINSREDAIVGKAPDNTNTTDQIVNGVTYVKGNDGLYYPKK